MIPSFFPVWLTGGAWLVFGSVPAANVQAESPALVPSADPNHWVAQYPPGVGLTPEQAAQTGQRFVLQTDGSTSGVTACVATVREVHLSAVIDTMDGFEPTAAPDRPLVTQVLEMTPRRHVLGAVELSGDCAGFKELEATSRGRVWARPESSPVVRLAAPVSIDANESPGEKALFGRATAEFRKLPLWAPIQAVWAKTEDAKEYPRWDDGVGIQVYTLNAAGQRWVYLSASASCSFNDAAWALWQIGAGDTWILRSDGAQSAPLPTFGSGADLDGDGVIELISNHGITSGAGGTWTRVLDSEVDWIGCAC